MVACGISNEKGDCGGLICGGGVVVRVAVMVMAGVPAADVKERERERVGF